MGALINLDLILITSRRLEKDVYDVFAHKDSSGLRTTPAALVREATYLQPCASSFLAPACTGSCSCPTTMAACKVKQPKCKVKQPKCKVKQLKYKVKQLKCKVKQLKCKASLLVSKVWRFLLCPT